MKWFMTLEINPEDISDFMDAGEAEGNKFLNSLMDDIEDVVHKFLIGSIDGQLRITNLPRER